MKPLLLLFIVFITFSCQSHDKKPDTIVSNTDSSNVFVDDTSNADTNTSNSITPPTSSSNIQVTGMAFYRLSYCGGARPTPEIEEQYRRQYPLADHEIVFYRQNESKKSITNMNGEFSVSLTVGSWDFSIVKKAGSTVIPAPDCSKYYERSYGRLFIKSDTMVQLLFHFPCNPCDIYGGMRP